jgi:hypothetical protein
MEIMEEKQVPKQVLWCRLKEEKIFVDHAEDRIHRGGIRPLANL